MNKVIIVFIILLMVSNICYSQDLSEDFQNTVERLEEAIQDNRKEDLNLLIMNKEIQQKMKEFLANNDVTFCIFIVERIKERDETFKVTVFTEIDFVRKGGFITHGRKFPFNLYFIYDNNYKVFRVVETNFFEEIQEKIPFYIYLILIITILSLIHAFKRRNIKWFLIIGLLNITGVILYYIFVIRKEKNSAKSN